MSIISNPLAKAAESGNVDAFEQLLKSMSTNDVKRLLPQALNVIFRNDAAAMIQAVYDNVTMQEGDMELHLSLAGLGENSSELKRNIIDKMILTGDFRKLIATKDFNIENALGNLLLRGVDESALMDKILAVINRLGPKESSHFTEHAIINSLSRIEDLRGVRIDCFNTGHDNNFQKSLEHLSQQSINQVVMTLAKLGSRPRQIGGLSAAKINAVIAKADPATIEEAYILAAANANNEVFRAIAENVVPDALAPQALLAACETPILGSKNNREDSLHNLRDILKLEQAYDDQLIFKAMQAAISAGKDGHLAELVEYAKEHYPNLVNQDLSDGSTLLIQASRAKDNDVSIRMATSLLSAGAENKPDRNGRDPMSLLAKKGLQGSAAWRAMDRMQDLQFEATRAAAQMRGRLGVLSEAAETLKNLGITDPNQMGPILAGLLGAPQQPMQQQPRLIQGEHTAREVKSEEEPGKSASAGK